MPPISVSTDVNRPPADVFAFATDPAHFSEWQKGVVEGHLEPVGGAEGLGARCITTRRIGFANRPSTAEITAFDPPLSWSARGIDGPIRAAVDVSVESLSQSWSRLTISVDFEGHGIGKALVPLVVVREARREMPVNLANLKSILERSTEGR
ncbi:MAG TPA: SRPBCC family protein [Acidimicrobiales bacterium]|jgi:uncharacterized protein YndB with AHSA1/START domain|nr:SRPBCC family protein [Acidimicrobiales bacterium]